MIIKAARWGKSRLETERPARRFPTEEINMAWCPPKWGLTSSQLFTPPEVLSWMY